MSWCLTLAAKDPQQGIVAWALLDSICSKQGTKLRSSVPKYSPLPPEFTATATEQDSLPSTRLPLARPAFLSAVTTDLHVHRSCP